MAIVVAVVVGLSVTGADAQQGRTVPTPPGSDAPVETPIEGVAKGARPETPAPAPNGQRARQRARLGERIEAARANPGLGLGNGNSGGGGNGNSGGGGNGNSGGGGNPHSESAGNPGSNGAPFRLVSFEDPPGWDRRHEVLQDFPDAVNITVAFGSNPDWPATMTGRPGDDLIAPMVAMLAETPGGPESAVMRSAIANGHLAASASNARIIGLTLPPGQARSSSTDLAYVLELTESELTQPIDFVIYEALADEN